MLRRTGFSLSALDYSRSHIETRQAEDCPTLRSWGTTSGLRKILVRETRVLAKVQRHFSPAIGSERPRGVAAIHDNFHVSSRAHHGEHFARITGSKRLGKNGDLLAVHCELDIPATDCLGWNMFRGEICHQVSKSIYPQHHAFYRLAGGLGFRHRETHIVR